MNDLEKTNDVKDYSKSGLASSEAAATTTTRNATRETSEEPSTIITATSTTSDSSTGTASTTTPTTTTTATPQSRINGDTLFEPSVDMMVNDFDDERTLEEEEALAATESEDPTMELSNLERESDMPIDELLALYNCRPPSSDTVGEDLSRTRSRSSNDSNSDADENDNENENENENDSEEQNDIIDEKEEASELHKLYPETYKLKNQKFLRTYSRQHSEEEDDEYSPEDEFKKTIMVGSDYQAVIPEGLCKYGDALPYENADKLIWDPSQLKENEIETYLQRANNKSNITLSTTTTSSSSTTATSTANSPSQQQTINSLPVGIHLRDDEPSLYLLLQCGHNVDEAIRRRRMNSTVPPPNPSERMSLWSEEECRNFEGGLRIYGKDFHTIQQIKVRTRSVGELVQFYYLWKKTERHDVFANKTRLDKKKYSLHPSLTDYMDRFLEEQESNGVNSTTGNSGGTGGGSGSIGGSGGGNFNLRDRSVSPGINSLLYADHKRQHRGGGGGGSGGFDSRSSSTHSITPSPNSVHDTLHVKDNNDSIIHNLSQKKSDNSRHKSHNDH